MALRNFKEWRLNEGKFRSQKSELECPHKKDPNYCREWKKYINGERNTDPINDPEFAHLKPKPRLGHSDRRNTSTPTRKMVMRGKTQRGEGKYKWRDKGDD